MSLQKLQRYFHELQIYRFSKNEQLVRALFC
jgi:hypothetical protein